MINSVRKKKLNIPAIVTYILAKMSKPGAPKSRRNRVQAKALPTADLTFRL